MIELPFVEDYTIVLFSVLILFMITSTSSNGVVKSHLLDLKSARKISWSILVLIGGGISLAGGFASSELDLQIANQLSFVGGMEYFLIILIVVTVTIFSGELMSNTAGAALMLPIMAALSTTLSINPILLMAPVAIATSYGFILPIATPPNTIVVGSGYVSAKNMARFGIPLNLISIVFVSVLITVLVPLV
nr:SLC13 family permease [Nitrosopumilus sp.]